jgi:WD40 repeat protein
MDNKACVWAARGVTCVDLVGHAASVSAVLAGGAGGRQVRLPSYLLPFTVLAKGGTTCSLLGARCFDVSKSPCGSLRVFFTTISESASNRANVGENAALPHLHPGPERVQTVWTGFLEQVLTASYDKTVRCWEAGVSRAHEVYLLKGHCAPVLCLNWAADGGVTSGDRGGDVLQWDVATASASVHHKVSHPLAKQGWDDSKPITETL